MNIPRRTAFITGASAGIGKATAFALAGLGLDLFLGARRAAPLQAVADDVLRAHPNARVAVHSVDVAQVASIEAFVAAGQAFAPCDVLINNAGLALGKDMVVKSNLDEWQQMLDVNIRGALFLAQHVAKDMVVRQAAGDIVMLGSIAAVEPYDGGAVYCGSKAALAAFSRALRGELVPHGIRVMLVEPGMVQTDFSTVRMRGDQAAADAVYAGMTPLSAEDVADTIAFALSRKRHVCLDRIQILATAQSGTRSVWRTMDQ